MSWGDGRDFIFLFIMMLDRDVAFYILYAYRPLDQPRRISTIPLNFYLSLE